MYGDVRSGRTAIKGLSKMKVFAEAVTSTESGRFTHRRPGRPRDPGVGRAGMLIPGVGGEVVDLMSHALDRLAKRMILSGAVGVGRNDRSPRLCPDYVLHNWEHGGDASAGTGQQQWGI